jgi:4-aminobutyrate aminotransferase-like enzyme
VIEIPPPVVNALRDDGIVIGRAGRDENVLKIRPPLVFLDEHAHMLLEAVSRALAFETRRA